MDGMKYIECDKLSYLYEQPCALGTVYNPAKMMCINNAPAACSKSTQDVFKIEVNGKYQTN